MSVWRRQATTHGGPATPSGLHLDFTVQGLGCPRTKLQRRNSDGLFSPRTTVTTSTKSLASFLGRKSSTTVIRPPAEETSARRTRINEAVTQFQEALTPSHEEFRIYRLAIKERSYYVHSAGADPLAYTGRTDSGLMVHMNQTPGGQPLTPESVAQLRQLREQHV